MSLIDSPINNFFFFEILQRTKQKETIDEITLKGALWVIRARLQRNKASKYTDFFLHISGVPGFIFEKKLSYHCK